MKHHARWLLLLSCLSWIPQPGSAADSEKILRTDLDRIFSDRRFADAQWGAEVFSLDRSKKLYEKNSRRLYIPASNNKILTAAAALIRLGPDFRFETRVLTDGQIENGVLRGNLIIRGSGDPSNPAKSPPGNSFGVFTDWASILREKNIRSIAGNLLGDAGAFDEIAFGHGWEWNDLGQAYAAPVSALQFNENSITIEITPGIRNGSPASIKTSPMADYPAVENKTVTGAGGASSRIRIEPGKAPESIVVSGSIPFGGPVITRTVAVQSPVLYYLAALKQALAEQGIDVRACEIMEKRNYTQPSFSLLWIQPSPVLPELLKTLLKTSQNLYAETLARALGLTLLGEGTFAKGKEIVEDTLNGMGIEKATYSYADASGLSRLNLISPDMLVRILQYMYRYPHFSLFYDALPIAGVDGTLESRMKGTKAENNLRAKTGTMAGVSAISGYIKTRDGEMLAFSVIANNFLTDKDAAERLQDRALLRLARFSRKSK